MDNQSKIVDEIVNDVRYLWGTEAVTDLGARYRVCNPAGGEPVFMPRVLKESNLKGQLKRLLSIGYDPADVQHKKEEERQRRSDAARDEDAKLYEKVDNMRRATEARKAAEAQAAAETAEAVSVSQVQAEEDARILQELEAEEKRRQEVLEKDTSEMASMATRVGSVRFDELLLNAQDAADLLEHNREFRARGRSTGPLRRSNRPQAPDGQLESWAKDMVNGDWVLIPHGIALDRDGYLLDGQNRLKALLLAERMKPGVEIPMMVSYDWDPDVFDRIDRGRPRSVGDLLAIKGEGNRFSLETTGRLVMHYYQDLESGASNWLAWGKKPISAHNLLDFIEKAGQPLHDAVNDGRWVNSGTTMLTSGVAAGLYVCRKAWPIFEGEVDPHLEFITGLKLGYEDLESGRVPLAAGDPRAALRNYVSVKRNGRNRTTHMGVYIKTWNNWIRRRDAQLVRFGKDETFPRAVERG